MDEKEGMEEYEGVKFRCMRKNRNFDFDDRLAQLDRWCYLLAELGLTPLHSLGASGNQSCRVANESFIITKSGMIPGQNFAPENYCKITGYDNESGTVYANGQCDPSSESVLHCLIYRKFPTMHSVMHGHSNLFIQHAKALELPVTSKFYEYGTIQLAESVLDVLDERNRFIILKNHGFVAVGKSVHSAGSLVLEQYSALLELLKGKDNL